MEAKKITVTLTARPPAKIDPEVWPRIASAAHTHACGQYSQNGEVTWHIAVRRHADGRHLVYRYRTGGCQCENFQDGDRLGDSSVPGGKIVPAGADLATAILAVAAGYDTGTTGQSGAGTLGADCVADLPPETLD